MPLQFQPPSFQQPLKYEGINNLPQTLDQVYQRALEYKKFQAQQQLQQQQMMANSQQMGMARLQTAPFGFAPEQVTPESIQQAGTGQHAPGSLGASIQAYMENQQKAMGYGYQKIEAELGKTRSEAMKTGQEGRQAELMNNLLDPSMQGQPGGGLIQNLNAARASGNMTPQQQSEYLSRNPLAHMALVNDMARGGQNIAMMDQQAAAKEAGMKSSAQLTEGGSSQQLARAANSAYKQFGLLQSASDKVSRYNTQLINKSFLDIAKQRSPEAQALMAALASARIEYARAASGSQSPSDVFMAEANKALPDSITPAQLPATITQLKANLFEMTQGQMTPATLQKEQPEQKKTKWTGGTTHTYADGTVARWNGLQWVKQ